MKSSSKIWAAYNIVQILTLPAVLPALAGICLGRDKYRGQFLLRMGRLPPVPDKKAGRRIWIHAMSLGEFNAARPLIEKIRQTYPDLELVLSASTASGLAALARSPLAKDSLVTALPYDFRPVVSWVIRRIRPDCFLLVETDIWPNFLWYLRRLGIPSLLVNGSISDAAAARLGMIRPVARLLYDPFSLLAMQSDDDLERLRALGINDSRLVNCGNLKFDHRPVVVSKRHRQDLAKAPGFPAGSRIITAGSTHPGEEEIILDAFSCLKRDVPEARLLIAPRDIKRSRELGEMIGSAGFVHGFRSDSMEGRKGPERDVFILDTLGELEYFYGIADVAIVGGSFVPVGGHNLLEPAAFGIPVIFGPFMESFRQVAELFLAKGAGTCAANSSELAMALKGFMKDDAARRRSGLAALALLDSNAGVVNRYMEMIRPFVAS